MLLGACGSGGTEADQDAASQKLTVAAAANLSNTIDQLAEAFTQKTGIQVVVSIGSTTSLTQQIENGAPFDLFAAADTEHIDQLIADGFAVPGSRAVYARGRLVAWTPDRGEDRGDLVLNRLEDLANPEVKFVAIANPELAPYGEAAVELLMAKGLWDAVEPKLVYGNNVTQALQLAETGNADAALVAYSLVGGGVHGGHVFGGDTDADTEPMHQPLDQALGIMTQSPHQQLAHQFADFLRSPEGQKILQQNGYAIPPR